MNRPDDVLHTIVSGLCRIVHVSLGSRWAVVTLTEMAAPVIEGHNPPVFTLSHILTPDDAVAFQHIPGVKAARSVLIHDSTGSVVGAVAALHDQPFTWSPVNDQVLQTTANTLSELLKTYNPITDPLREPEERFRALFEQSVMGILYVDTKGSWLRVNQTMLNMLGYTAEEFQKLSIVDFTHPDDLTADLDYIRRMQADEIDSYTLEKRYIRKDGSMMFGVLRVSKVRSQDGNTIYYVGHVTDVTEQKEADERISYQANLLANVTDAVISTDLNFAIRTWNHAAELIYGYSASEAIGQPVNVILRQELSDEERDQLQDALLANGSWQGEVIHFHRDGHFIHIFAHVSLVRDPQGKLLGTVAVNRDITEKKRADQQLQHTIKQLADLKFALDQSAIVAITDQRGRILEVNDKFTEISGFTRDELIGEDHEIVNSGYHPREFIRGLWTTIAGGRVWRGEMRNRAKDGSIYWVDTTIVPFLTQRGKPYQYIAIRYDTTQRKFAEEALQRSNREISTILESIGDAFYAVDRKWQFTYINKHAEVLLQRSAEELIGKSLWEEFPETVNSLIYPNYTQVMETGTPMQFEEYYEPFESWFDMRVYPSDTGISVYFSNINARKEHERQQFQLAMERERVDILADFIRSASHDFRTPLTIIKTNLYLLERVEAPEQRQNYLTTLKEQANAIELLVNDMLEMNRLETITEFTLSSTSLNTLVSTATNHVEHLAQEKGLELYVQLSEEPVIVEADGIELQRALLNIVHNAVQFTPSGGTITLITRQEQHYALIEVRDTGVGIPEDVKPHIFTPFFRGDKARTTRGAGLGLSISQRIIEAHGGTIELVESTPGEGSLFRIRLPLIPLEV